MPDGSPWPRISIVTPSFNQGQFIEETLRSVLLQGYPNLEYIVMDGGSTDESVAIIEKYSPWLAYWTSKKDRGQADAINKGFARATGQLMAFLNSDDVYAPSILADVAAGFVASGRSARFWVTYPVENFGLGADYSVLAHEKIGLGDWIYKKEYMHQPGVFWASHLFRDAGFLDARYFCAFDQKLFMGFVAKGFIPTARNSRVAARARQHGQAKTIIAASQTTGKNICSEELQRIAFLFSRFLPSPARKKYVEENVQHILDCHSVRVFSQDSRWGRVKAIAATVDKCRPCLRTRFFWGMCKRALFGRVR
jgi:hypothetical protein